MDIVKWLGEAIVRMDMGNNKIRKGAEKGRKKSGEGRNEGKNKGQKWAEGGVREESL